MSMKLAMGMQRLHSVSALLVVAFVAGCSSGNYNRAGGPNVRPGEKNYPEANPHPLHTILVTGTADSSLRVQLYSVWGAKSDAPDCGFSHIEMDTFPNRIKDTFSAAIPIALTWSETSFRGSVAADGFLAGHCNWTFGGLIAATDGQVVNNGYAIISYAQILATNSPPLEDGETPNGRVVMACSLAHGTDARLGSSQLLCSADRSPLVIWWYPTITSIEIHLQNR